MPHSIGALNGFQQIALPKLYCPSFKHVILIYNPLYSRKTFRQLRKQYSFQRQRTSVIVTLFLTYQLSTLTVDNFVNKVLYVLLL